MRKILRAIIGLGVLRRLATGRAKRERIIPPADANPGAETALIVLLLLAITSAVTFIWVYADDSLPNRTQIFFVSAQIIGLLAYFAYVGRAAEKARANA